jgi:acetyl-CoA carboxylase carboxyltransferase component
VPVLADALDRRSETAARNREAVLTHLAEIEEQLDLARAGGGQKYVERHHGRGKLLARERIELLVDRDSPFLELSPLAAWGTAFPVGASVITGIGVIEGVECMLIANDPTVRGGATNPVTAKKVGRAMDIARENRLPLVNLVESGGADLPTQAEIFIPGGRMFHQLTSFSAAGIPTVALVFGNSTAGGAYVPGMCDHVVMVKQRAKVFLGGPPLVKMATGEESDDESLGGAEMHARTSGLADHLAEDELDALRLGRQVVRNLNHRRLGPAPSMPADPPLLSEDELLDLAPSDLRIPFDPRDVLARVLDGSRFDEFKPLYGTSLVTGWGSIHGYPVGVLANARGVLFGEESQKAAQFIQLANSARTPLVFLQNTTGYMVGKEYEQRGIIKDGAKMINAVSNSRVPHLTMVLGRLLRRRPLRHVRAGVRPALPVLLARREVGGDGAGPAGRGAVHRLAAVGGGARAALRRGGRRADARAGRDADREGVAGPGEHRPRLRRRHHRPARHPDRPRAVPVRRAQPGRRRRRGLRGVAALMTTTPVTRVLVANRGEIARRVFRTCREMGIETVAVFSDADAGLPHAREADVAVRLPGSAPTDTYLRTDLLLDAAARTGADAVHPGYGFLSEDAAFARAVIDAGLAWIGPPADAVEAMGSKLRAKAMMTDAGVPVLPGADVTGLSADEVTAAADAIGYPVLVKASAGGGGRGMRIVAEPLRWPTRSPARSARRRRRSATAPCSSSATSSGRATSRCRWWPTPTAAWSRCSSATARCSAGTRRCSRRRRRRRWTTRCAPGCATPPWPRPAPSTTPASARSSSCSRRTASPRSWR